MDEFDKRALKVPSCDEFTSIFGCDCKIDQDLIQVCEFEDELGGDIRITFGLLDNSFGISVFHNGYKFLEMYDECLAEVSLDESKNIINVKFVSKELSRTVKITVWPKIFVCISVMR